MMKLADQYKRYGKRSDGMPPIFVTLGKDGEMQSIDGLTRATRMFRYAPGTLVAVEVVKEFPRWNLSNYPRLEDIE